MTTVLESLNTALHQLFAQDERVYLLGEDILDPYGGAFKVTRGLSDAYPQRVLSTPISEAGIVGIATGMALRGLRPIVEIMFGDFITLTADQVINHMTKFRWMYNDKVRVPLVIRTPMGGRRGYGPTHSQTLEKLFLGVPGLHVLAPCDLGDPGSLLKFAVEQVDDPVLFVENKLLYLSPLIESTITEDFTINRSIEPTPSEQHLEHDLPGTPTYTLQIRGAPPASLTLAAYGYMGTLARQAMVRLAYEYEIFTELVIPTQLAPFNVAQISSSAQKTGKLLIIEEGSRTLGWGAEVIARLADENLLSSIQIKRLGALDLPIPASGPLEASVLPGVELIIQTSLEMV